MTENKRVNATLKRMNAAGFERDTLVRMTTAFLIMRLRYSRNSSLRLSADEP